MRNKFLLLWGISFLFLIILSIPAKSQQLVDRIVATINGKIITEKELEKEILWNQKEWGLDKEKISKKEILESMIEEKLLLMEAEKRKITVTEEEVEGAFEKKEKELSLEKLEEILKGRETSLEEFKERLKKEILLQKLIAEKMREIDREISIKKENVKAFYAQLKQYIEGRGETGKEVREFYKIYQKELAEKSLVKIAYIVEEDKEKAKTILQKFKKEEFSSEQGWINLNLREINPSLREAILNLKEGEISNLIEMDGAFCIVKLIKKSEFSFEEFKDKIENYLKREKEKEILEKWINDLKSKTRIEILI